MATDLDARLPRFSVKDEIPHNEKAEGSTSQHNTQSTMAERVNALSVYEDAVQEPLLECSNLASMYYQAQRIGSRRPDAKILREDFCSSAIVAQTWLELSKENRSQGVDIDLKALKVAQKRFMASGRSDRQAIIIQSAQFSDTGKTKKLTISSIEQTNDLTKELSEIDLSNSSNSSLSTSTWAKGAASDRFERRFQARLAKENMKAARKSATSNQDDEDIPTAKGDVMILQHADVLSLPIEGLDDEIQIERPDLIYAGNYALSYFHDRKSLLAYLAQCKRTLRKQTGVLIVDPFAGPTNWEVKTEQESAEQDDLWKQFSSEPGFLRTGEQQTPLPLKGDPLEFWTSPTNSNENSADYNQWPRGRLILVRKGLVNEGEYEYWREDGPLDYTTNRFRMSLSFRFTADGSWLRDYFSYDFRVWSLREITEAMEEVGFENVSVHAIPRTTESDRKEKEGETGRQLSDDESDADESENDEDGLNGMANLMERTEKHEAGKSTYKIVEPEHKLFATKSFGTYIIACMPFDEQEGQ